MAMALANPAQADILIFNDNFDTNNVGLNSVPTGWTVSDGTVDINGTGLDDFIPGSGNYIDLDGTSYDAGVLSIILNLSAGTQYVAFFDLAGNQRNESPENVTVYFVGNFNDYSLPRYEGWTQFSQSFTPLSTGSYTLSFANSGGDSVGMLLDNVSVIAVPEPDTYTMILLGLGLIGLLVRQRG